MKSSRTTTFWNVFLSTVTAVCVVHVAATSSDDQRYHSLDALLRRSHENGMTGALYDDDDYDADGCISVLIYDNDDCSGPVKKLVRAPVKAESNCGR